MNCSWVQPSLRVNRPIVLIMVGASPDLCLLWAHDARDRDCPAAAVRRQRLRPDRALPQRRRRQQRRWPRNLRLDVQALGRRPVPGHRARPYLRRRQPAYRSLGQASGELGLCRRRTRFLRAARREVGVRPRQRRQRQHARGRRGGRDRLPQRPAVRAQGRDRPDRPQPRRLDGGARRRRRTTVSRRAGSRPPSPITRPARRSSTATSPCRS